MNSLNTIKYTFSGHDSFQCRYFWLKKGYDFVTEKRSFNDEDAVVILGVGRNMVNSIRFWLKAFNIVDSNDVPTAFGIKLLDNNGWDPFLEDEASLWLLHYQLVKTNIASIYNIIFNDFRKEKVIFNKDAFINYMKRRKEIEESLNFNENTLAADFDVFLKMYKGNDEDTKDIEDSFSGILSELELLQKIENIVDKKREISFQIPHNEKNNIPKEIILFSILDNADYGLSVSFNTLVSDNDSPGSIFSINQTGLLNKINEITSDYDQIIYTDHAGIKELQFKGKPSSHSIMDGYYDK